MHRVYGVDPEALSGFTPTCQALESFGFEQGRLVARYPKAWQRQVHDACSNCSDGEKKRVEVALARLKHRAMVASEAAYDGNQAWRTNAHSQSHYFSSIVQRTNPEGHAFVLTEFDLHDGNSNWQVTRELNIPRNAAAIVALVGELLKHSNDAHFVDRYYRGKREQNNVIGACLRKLGPARTSTREVVVHTDDTGLFSDKLRAARYLLQSLPPSTTLRLISWRPREGGEGFHARYLLTDRGGFRIDWGFDEHDDQTTDVGILSDSLYEKRWQEMRTGNWACEKVDEAVIV